MAGHVKEWFTQLKKWTVPNFDFFMKPTHIDTPEEQLTKALGKYESYVFKIQGILYWHDPVISFLYILAANFVFWFVINYECRFYSLLFTSILACFLYDMWVDQIWPTISLPVPEKEKPVVWTPQHPSGLLSVPEVSRYISQTNSFVKDWIVYLKTLRNEHPAVFCLEMCAVMGALAVIGRTVPGVVIGYVALMSVLIGPGICIHVLPQTTVDKLATILTNLRPAIKGESDSEPDELLPDFSETNMALFQEATEPDCSDKEDNAEFGLDADSSLLTSSGGKDNNSLDTLEDFELSPRAPSASRSDSDGDDEAAGIHFRSSHFNGDSSEEDELRLGAGLAFPDTSKRPAKVETLQSSMLTNLAQNLVSMASNVVSRSIGPPVKTDSSDSNEEFEIIDRDDVS